MDRSFSETVLAGESTHSIYNRIFGKGNVGGLLL